MGRALESASIDAAFAPALAAIEAGRIPGAVLGVLGPGGRAVRWAGAAQLVPKRRPMRRDTWFDLASLTKPMFTTTAILSLDLDLDSPLCRYIPDLRQYDMAAPERSLTIRQCLGHQTHLPAVEPIYTYGEDAGTLRAFVLQRAWRRGPPVYSDINFLFLGILLERVRGMGILDMPTAPGLSFRPKPALCAATEFCTWRSRVMRGEVHDENAWAFQGAGHAGLFGTVDGVLDFAGGVLQGGDPRLHQRVGGHRGLGWELPHPGWSGGALCSPGTIGHTGFTGTGLWIDRERGLAWALLTNRVHPSRHTDSGIAALRIATGEAVCMSGTSLKA